MLLALLLAQAQTPDLTRPIDFASPPARLANILPALESTLGAKLEAASETRDEVLVIRVKAVPGQGLLDRIATACSAKWEQVDGRLKLVRPEEMDRAEAESDLKEDEAIWAKALRSSAAELKQRDPMTRSSASAYVEEVARHNAMRLNDNTEDQLMLIRRMEAIAKRAPLFALAAEVLQAMTARDLALLPNQKQVVYSTAPTSVELQAPATMLPVIKQFEDAQAALIAAVHDNPRASVQAQPRTGINIDRLAVPLDQPRYVFSFFRRGEHCAVTASVLNRGSQLLMQSTAEAGELSAKLYPYESDPHADDIVRFSPAVEDLQASVRNRFTKGSNDVSPETMERLTHPEKVDPLALGTADGFLSYADIEQKNVVVRLADEYRIPPIGYEQSFKDRLGVPVKTWVSQFRRALRWTEADGWIVAKPRRARENRIYQIDRAALGTLLRHMHERGGASLDDYAEFYAGIPVGADGLSVLNSVVPYVQGTDVEAVGIASLLVRFYGSLTREQRAAVWTPTGLQLDFLSSRQREYANDAVYGSGMYMRLAATGPNPQFPGAFVVWPCEVIGNGIPAGATLRGSYTMAPGAIARATNPNGFQNRPMFLDSISIQRMLAKQEFIGQYDQFRPAARCVGALNLWLQKDKFLDFQFNYAIPNDGSKFGKLEDLPPPR